MEGGPGPGFPEGQCQRAPFLAGGRPLWHETPLPGSTNALGTSEHAGAKKIAISRLRPVEPLTMSRFGPPDSIRQRVGRPCWARGLALGFPEGQRQRVRPFLHESHLPGSRNPLWTTEHAETQRIAISRPRPGDPLKISRFGPHDSIRRRVGRPCWQGGPDPRFSSQRVPFLAGGGRFLHEMLLPGSRNALGTSEHAETPKIAISRLRPGNPLAMSHFGPPDSIRRRVGRPLFGRGPLAPEFLEVSVTEWSSPQKRGPFFA